VKRSRLRRGPWRRKKNRPPRPGETSKPPSNLAWRKLCLLVRKRDRELCVRCGRPALGASGHVDHVWPRRLFAQGEQDLRDHLSNLMLLCLDHHSEKTQRIEQALYAGDLVTFLAWLGPSLVKPEPLIRTTAIDGLLRLLRRAGTTPEGFPA